MLTREIQTVSFTITTLQPSSGQTREYGNGRKGKTYPAVVAVSGSSSTKIVATICSSPSSSGVTTVCSSSRSSSELNSESMDAISTLTMIQLTVI
jgi:hypothetical protein